MTRSSAVAALLTLLPAPAFSQDFSVFVDNSLSTLRLQIPTDQIVADAGRDDGDERARDTPDIGGDFTFNRSSRRTANNLQAMVERARVTDPQGAAAMERLFASTDIIDAIDGKMRTIGLRADNVADAYAVWWMLAWHATRGTKAEPTTTTALAVRDQAARAILATPEFANADDAAKQQMAEALLVQAMLVDGMNEEYGSDPAIAAKLAQAVNDGAGKMGLDLTAMELTPAGFVAR